MGKSVIEQLAEMGDAQVDAFLDAIGPDEVVKLARGDWQYTARPEQVPPSGRWGLHLVLSGRGFGKTRAGAEWLVERTKEHPFDRSGFPTERLVVAYNLSDARAVCIEGPSGILRSLDRQEIEYHYTKSPKPMIIFQETGARIHFTGADNPNIGRGLNLADTWCDEIVKWDNPKEVWQEGIKPALRANIEGDKPRAFVTTTPKPIQILRDWLAMEDGSVSVVRGSTFDNRMNLNQEFLDDMKKMYEGTNLGRQELYGEMLDMMEGPLFSWSHINNNRMEMADGDIVARVVGVDPNLTADDEGDEMGVVVASRNHLDHMFVIADESVRLAGEPAARHIWTVFAKYEADYVIVEDNLGKQWLVRVLTDAFEQMCKEGFFPRGTTAPLKTVHSNHGKKLRAEPVSMRYQQGRVHHLGTFEKLENQMVSWDPLSTKNSPDRLDALVHACNELMLGERRKVAIASPMGILIPSAGVWGF